MEKNISAVYLLCACTLFIFGCGLFDNLPEANLEKKMDEAVNYARAPWVPMRIETGGLGTAIPFGNQNQKVKKGYSFTLNFQPLDTYPFTGWQAWYGENEPFAYWLIPEEPELTPVSVGKDRVKFEPKNLAGTEV